MVDFNQFHQQAMQNELRRDLMNLEALHHWNPVIILFIVWHVENHRGPISQARLRALQVSIATWHDRIVKPLLCLDRQFFSTEIKACIHELVQQALSYECVLLEEQVAAVQEKVVSLSVNVEDMCRAVLSYSKLTAVQLAQEDVATIKSLLCYFFPDQYHHSVHAVCDDVFAEYCTVQPLGYEQLMLDEL